MLERGQGNDSIVLSLNIFLTKSDWKTNRITSSGQDGIGPSERFYQRIVDRAVGVDAGMFETPETGRDRQSSFVIVVIRGHDRQLST